MIVVNLRHYRPCTFFDEKILLVDNEVRLAKRRTTNVNNIFGQRIMRAITGR